MTTFKAGQKVRDKINGYCATFVEYTERSWTGMDCRIQMDAVWKNAYGHLLPASEIANANSAYLEPLTPPGELEITAEEILQLPTRGNDCPAPLPEIVTHGDVA